MNIYIVFPHIFQVYFYILFMFVYLLHEYFQYFLYIFTSYTLWYIFYIDMLFFYHIYNENVFFCRTINTLSFPLPPSTPPARRAVRVLGFPGLTCSASQFLHRFLYRFLFMFTSFFEDLLKVFSYLFHAFFDAKI